MYLRLKGLREANKISQAKLAEATGLIAKNLSNYEKGKRVPDLETLTVLADYFGVPIDYLVGRESEISTKPDLVMLSKFGYRIKEFREKNNILLKDLSERCGISPNYVAAIESGTEIPSLATCIIILNALNLSANTALMDSLWAGHTEKACYISDQIDEFPPNARETILDIMESLITSYKSKQIRITEETKADHI